MNLTFQYVLIMCSFCVHKNIQLKLEVIKGVFESEVKICYIQPKFALKTSTTFDSTFAKWMHNIIKY